MRELVFESVVNCTPEELWAFHADVSALKLLTPPGSKVEILGPDTAVAEGALHRLHIVRMGLPLRWDARISEVNPPHGFTDTAEKSPFAAWSHRHEFLPHTEGTLLRDTVRYRLPLGFLGRLVDAVAIRKDVETMFKHRHSVTKDQFRSN